MRLYKLALVLIVVIIMLSSIGCKRNYIGAKSVSTLICQDCGEIKGSDECCVEAETCEKCGLHKGSPGCCKDPVETSGTTELCDHCGEIKGSDECCTEAEICEKCGLHKGSPGCCEIENEKTE